MKSVTNGSWSRIGDLQFGLALKRYSTGSNGTSTNANDTILWRMEVTRGPGRGSDVLLDLDATVKDLREMQRWCEKAIETVQSDGGRLLQDEEKAA